MKKLRLIGKEAGDTIIEVLIASAVISSVLGSAYVISTRSLRTGQAAQERVEAIKLIEEQIERLKYEARSNTNFDSLYRDASGTYCIAATGTSFIKRTNPSLTTFNDDCVQGTERRYRLNVTYRSSGPTFGTFVLTANWDSLVRDQEQAVINYQL